jgi:salicylate biosynthesis isochorismate synthase
MSADAVAVRAGARHAARPGCRPADAAAYVREALERSAGALAIISVPAPVVAPRRLLGLFGGEPSIMWCPAAGPGFAGVGEAARLQPGQGLREQASALWRKTVQLDFPGSIPAPPARVFGGLAFAPGAADAPPWSEFGDGGFALPRWRYCVDGDHAWLSLAGVRNPPESAAQLAQLLVALSAPQHDEPPAPHIARLEQEPLSQWSRQVDDIRAAISRGEVEKIVAARRCTVELCDVIDEIAVLARLDELYPDCFRYGFRRGLASFVGASPERLILKQGAHIETQALAGSIGANGGAAAETELFRSGKDLREHQFVVRAIVDQLAPLCSEIEAPRRPEICSLRDLLHLRTPIVGQLRGASHILDLVAALHPTPAVGGVPRERAMGWIREREAAARGWYAGPVGWFDGDGDGEFAVALRSGLLVGNHAYIYAGAGIVAGSDATAEYGETGLKQRALLSALGVRG